MSVHTLAPHHRESAWAAKLRAQAINDPDTRGIFLGIASETYETLAMLREQMPLDRAIQSAGGDDSSEAIRQVNALVCATLERIKVVIRQNSELTQKCYNAFGAYCASVQIVDECLETLRRVEVFMTRGVYRSDQGRSERVPCQRVADNTNYAPTSEAPNAAPTGEGKPTYSVHYMHQARAETLRYYLGEATLIAGQKPARRLVLICESTF